MKKFKYTIPGMNCAHCEKKITEALKVIPGIVNLKADSKTKSLEFGYKLSDDPSPLIENTLELISYPASPANGT